MGEDDPEEDDDVRRVWLWVHPAAAREALREVRRACALEGAPWEGSVQVCLWTYVRTAAALSGCCGCCGGVSVVRRLLGRHHALAWALIEDQKIVVKSPSAFGW